MSAAPSENSKSIDVLILGRGLLPILAMENDVLRNANMLRVLHGQQHRRWLGKGGGRVQM